MTGGDTSVTSDTPAGPYAVGHTLNTVDMIKYVFAALASAVLLGGCTGQDTVSLDSSNPDVEWQVKPYDDLKSFSGQQISSPGFDMGEYVPGVVPGTVFTAYVGAGLEENPDYADNIYRVDETFYNRPFWYRTSFTLPDSYRRGDRVWMHFDNINRFADFYFNGQKISGTPESTKDVSGHMLRSKFDVTSSVSEKGENIVAVLVYDPDQKKTRDASDFYGVVCSPSYLAGAGWDWMPYVPGRLAGITGHTYLRITGDAVLSDPWIRSDLPSADRAELSFSTDIVNTSGKEKDVTLSGVIQPGNIRFSKKVSVPADTVIRVSADYKEFPQLAVVNPRLWWPNGYGEPALYTCNITCKVDGRVSDTRKIDFGIRKYEYRAEKNAAGMPVLNFYVNGKRIYVKGGNWGMSEYLLRCQGDEYEPKIRLHKEMNYNMIRLWTGCVTDDEFYDWCDRYGIMVWNDFWLYVAYNDVAQPEAFKANALDKVKRLRNHPCIALWCGANECHPPKELDDYMRKVVREEDNNDRMYKSCSNQDSLSGSGWWRYFPPKHHFETSGSNLAFNKPAYPYGIDHGYGMRSEIGMPTFPTFESVRLFIPEEDWWPLPDDEQLNSDDDNVWNLHFFGKSASNAAPADYRHAIDDQYGESSSLEEFCAKAQLLNLETMKGMYEAWNDKMWNDAAGLLLWMSHPAYPSFVWQTYDYYYDPTGAYWGAKKACEHIHIQWNCSNGSVKAVNTTSDDLHGLTATARLYDLSGNELVRHTMSATVDVPSSGIAEAFVLDCEDSVDSTLSGLYFIRLELKDAGGNLLSENFYWRDGSGKMDYRKLCEIPETRLSCAADGDADPDTGRFELTLKNEGESVAFATRIRLTDPVTGERILPAIMSDGYVTLMPGEEKAITVEADPSLLGNGVRILLKQGIHPERSAFSLQD